MPLFELPGRCSLLELQQIESRQREKVFSAFGIEEHLVGDPIGREAFEAERESEPDVGDSHATAAHAHADRPQAPLVLARHVRRRRVSPGQAVLVHEWQPRQALQSHPLERLQAGEAVAAAPGGPGHQRGQFLAGLLVLRS